MIDLHLAANGLRASVALKEAGLPYGAHKVDLAKIAGPGAARGMKALS